MKTSSLILAILLFLPILSVAKETTHGLPSISDLDNRLEEYLHTQFDFFRVSENFSKDHDKKTIIGKSLGEPFVEGVIGTTYKDLFFRDIDVKNTTHIGVVILVYSDEKLAKSAMKSIDKSGYFENTKIFTEYTSQNTGNKNVILYTESSGDKLISSFMDKYFDS